MQVAILAGGVAARMRPLSDRLPKSLFPVAGRAFLDHQLERIARLGGTRVVLCLGHRAAEVSEHLARHPPGIPVTVSDEGDARLGTAGALRLAAERGLLQPELLVTYGDSFLAAPFAPLLAAHRRAGVEVTMSVLRNDDRWDRSNCVVEAGAVVCYAQSSPGAARPAGMRWIDYGLLALDRALLERLVVPVGGLGLSQELARLAASSALAAHEVSERFYEIGSWSGLAELSAHLERSP